jgi:hypothetical protein
MPFRKTFLAALLAASTSQAWAQITDSDADLLIDIASVEDLEMMRLPTEEWQALCLTAPCRGFELVNDINFDTDGDGDLSDEENLDDVLGFEPITLSDAVFEGNHHTIYNLYVDTLSVSPGGWGAGLFYILTNTEMRNITFDGDLSYIATTWGSGLLAGRVFDSRIENVFVRNGEVKAYSSAGGLVGWLETSEVVNSSVSSGVSVNTIGLDSYNTPHLNHGGLIGFAENSRIERSWANASVNVANIDRSLQDPANRFRAAGLIGTLRGSTIVASYSNAVVEGSRDHKLSGLANVSYSWEAQLPWADGSVVTIRDSEIIGSFSGTHLNTPSPAGLAYVEDRRGSSIIDVASVLDRNAAEFDLDWESTRNPGVVVDSLRDLEHSGSILEGNLYFGSMESDGALPDNLRIRYKTPQLLRDPTLEVANYWVRNTAIEDGEIAERAGAYSAQDLKCPTMPSDPNCGDGTLYAGWDLFEDSNGERIWYFGEGNETPFLYTKSLYPWQDNESPGGNGDYETRARIESNDPDNECLDDENAEIEAKIPGSGVVIRNNYPDVLASFNLRDGLICQNSDQADGSCGDYEVSYLCEPFWTQWESRDTPSGNSDAERRERSDVACSNPKEIRARLISDPDTIYYGPHDRLSSFSANEGLVCRNGEQGNSTCSNYAVRLTCDIKGQPINQRDI